MVTRPTSGACQFHTRDNSGIRGGYSVNFQVRPGGLTEILASITRVTPPPMGEAPKFKKGDLVKLVVLGRRSWFHRRGGVHTRLGYNGVIALKKDGTPVATRVWGPIALEARPAGLARLVVLSRGLV